MKSYYKILSTCVSILVGLDPSLKINFKTYENDFFGDQILKFSKNEENRKDTMKGALPA